ncbi:MAG: LysM peptidoglycan-binding domain-containing protein [Cyanobacteria bacterium REEB65]|nr:LysM peptidoglycan-binding domain-containing protein [Cyanobacteria bacterium REEB65]
MNARRFTAFAASLPDRPGIDAELSFLLSTLDAPPKRSFQPLPVAAAVTVVLGTAGQAFAHASKHVVVSGESLYRIAERQLGDASRWPEIARLNHLLDPARIQIGQVLLLPSPKVAAAHGSRQLVHPRMEVSTVAAGHRAGIASHSPIEIVPAGAIVAELPAPKVNKAKSHDQIVPAGAVVLELPAPHHGALGASHFSVLPHWQPAIPAAGAGWLALDGLAFLAGIGFGLRVLAGMKAHLAAGPQLAPVVAPSEFWNRVPASQDLRALQTS